MDEKRRAGFVALLGAPNAGKSTLTNHLAKHKVSVVTRKSQTTRTRIRAIVCRENCQYIFVDTPGIFAPKDSFDRAMVNMALASAQQADMLWLIIDAAAHDAEQKADALLDKISDALSIADKPMAVLFNKIDLVKKEKLLGLAERIYQKLQAGAKKNAGIFMVSALTGDGCEALFDTAKNFLPESPFLYPEDQLADMPMKLMAAEITRGHIFERIHQEIPYGVAVETMRWYRQKNSEIRVDQNIYISREGFKPILLGKSGQTIKQISQAARVEIAALTGKKIHLFLFVKYQENWRAQKEFRLMQGMDE